MNDLTSLTDDELDQRIGAATMAAADAPLPKAADIGNLSDDDLDAAIAGYQARHERALAPHYQRAIESEKAAQATPKWSLERAMNSGYANSYYTRKYAGTGFIPDMQAARAQSRLEEGTADDDDLATIAEHRLRQQIDAEIESGMSPAQRAGTQIGTIPSQLAQLLAGGVVAKALMPARLAQATGPLAVAGRTAVEANLNPAFVPMMAVHQNLEHGRDPLDWRGLPAAEAQSVILLGVLKATGVLGTKVGEKLMPNAGELAKVLAAGAAGPATMQINDFVNYAAGVTTRYGALQEFLEGKHGEAAAKIVTDAVMFGTFRAMHGQPEEGRAIIEGVRDSLDTQARRGTSAKRAVKSLNLNTEGTAFDMPKGPETFQEAQQRRRSEPVVERWRPEEGRSLLDQIVPGTERQPAQPEPGRNFATLPQDAPEAQASPKAKAEVLPVANPEAASRTASPSPSEPGVLIDVRAEIARHDDDMGKAGDAIRQRVADHLKDGGTVSVWKDGKEVPIVGVEGGWLRDAEGKPWGTGSLAMGSPGTKNGVELKLADAVKPQLRTPAQLDPQQVETREAYLKAYRENADSAIKSGMMSTFTPDDGRYDPVKMDAYRRIFAERGYGLTDEAFDRSKGVTSWKVKPSEQVETLRQALLAIGAPAKKYRPEKVLEEAARYKLDKLAEQTPEPTRPAIDEPIQPAETSPVSPQIDPVESGTLPELEAAAKRSGMSVEVARKKVGQLGNVEAVDKLFDSDSALDRYARAFARQTFGESATPTAPSPESAPKRSALLDYADRLEREAMAALKDKLDGKFFSGIDPTAVPPLAKLVAAKIIKGGYQLADFARELVARFGDGAAPYVDAIWKAATRHVESGRKAAGFVLSDREQHVLKERAKGRTHREIAEDSIFRRADGSPSTEEVVKTAAWEARRKLESKSDESAAAGRVAELLEAVGSDTPGAMDEYSRRHSLTDRERMVLTEVAKGRSTLAISRDPMFRGEGNETGAERQAVEVMRTLRRKLGIDNLREALKPGDSLRDAQRVERSERRKAEVAQAEQRKAGAKAARLEPVAKPPVKPQVVRTPTEPQPRAPKPPQEIPDRTAEFDAAGLSDIERHVLTENRRGRSYESISTDALLQRDGEPSTKAAVEGIARQARLKLTRPSLETQSAIQAKLASGDRDGAFDLAGLTKNERFYVNGRLDKRSLADLGRQMGVTRERARQVEAEAVAKMGGEASLEKAFVKPAIADALLTAVERGEESFEHIDSVTGRTVRETVGKIDRTRLSELSGEYDPESGKRLRARAKDRLAERIETRDEELDKLIAMAEKAKADGMSPDDIQAILIGALPTEEAIASEEISGYTTNQTRPTRRLEGASQQGPRIESANRPPQGVRGGTGEGVSGRGAAEPGTERPAILKFADDLEARATASLKSKVGPNRPTSGVDITLAADMAKIVAARMIRGSYTFAQFSADALNRFGESVRPLLREIWGYAEEYAAVARKMGDAPTEAAARDASREADRLHMRHRAEADALKGLDLSAGEYDGFEFSDLKGVAKLLRTLSEGTKGERIAAQQKLDAERLYLDERYGPVKAEDAVEAVERQLRLTPRRDRTPESLDRSQPALRGLSPETIDGLVRSVRSGRVSHPNWTPAERRAADAIRKHFGMVSAERATLRGNNLQALAEGEAHERQQWQESVDARNARGDTLTREQFLESADAPERVDEVAPGILFAGAPLQITALDGFLKKGTSVSWAARKWLTSAGQMPRDAFDLNREREQTIGAYALDVRNAERDLKAAVGGDYGRVNDATRRAMDNALKGNPQALAALPGPVRDVIDRMRTEVDALSHELIQSGAVDGPLAAVIDANKGVYLTRAYRVFTDPKWAEKVPEEVRNRFKSWFRAENPGKTPEEIDALMRSLLYEGTAAESPIAFLSKSKLGSKDLSILGQRKDLPEELRALWGEYDDPLVNYTNSVGKMASLLANHKFLTRVREAGLGRYLTPEPSGENIVRIAKEGNPSLAPLDGLYTTPEIKKAFEDVYSPPSQNAALSLYMKALGLAKYSKTVLSPLTHLRNFFGNAGFALANGHLQIDKAFPALKSVVSDSAEGRAYYRRLVELGVVGDGVAEGEFKAVVRDAMAQKDTVAGEVMGMVSDRRIARWVKGGLELAAKSYQAEDATWKTYAFENEKARYAKAFPDWTPEQVERRAAEIVRDTYLTYSMTPAAVQAVRRFPLVGPFVSFPSEVVRTTYKTMQLAVAEMRDPATRSIGATRAAGLVAALGASAGLQAATRALFGIDRDEEEAMRRLLPEWSRNSPLLHLGKNAKGERRYIDLGTIDPHAYLIKPVMAMLRGQDVHQSLLDAGNAIADPFAQEEIGTSAVLDIARNKRPSGREVYNPQASATDQAKAIGGRVWEAFEPGAVPSAKRLGMAATGEPDPKTGRKYALGDEALANTTGLRLQSVRVDDSLGFRARAFDKAKGDAQRLLSEVVKSRGMVGEQELRTAYQRMEVQRRRVYEEMRQDVLAAQKLGLTKPNVRAILKNAGVGDADASDLLEGRYRPFTPPQNLLKPPAVMREGDLTPEERRRRAEIMRKSAP